MPAPAIIGKRKANAAGWIFTRIEMIIPAINPIIPAMALKNTMLQT
jgi:hypothetical protein